MAGERGVTCPRCGASTPLPENLQTPSFACAFCQATLETAAFAGRAAVSADALLGHLNAVMSNPAAAKTAGVSDAPRFHGGSTESRAAACRDCGAPVSVPLDLEVRAFTCAGCGRAQQINAYISDGERFQLDMVRQTEGNAALKRARAEGLPCRKCGAHNAVPDDASIQFPCRFCGTPVLLADHVDASAVARHRLAGGVFAMRDELIAKQMARDRRVKIGVILFVVLAIGGFAIANLIIRGIG